MLRFHSKVNAENKNPEPRVSVAGEFKDGYLYLGVSRCTKKDRFNKKKGNQIAEGRMMKAMNTGKFNTSFTARFKTDDLSVKFFMEKANEVSQKMIVDKTIVTLGEQQNEPKSVFQKIREFVGV